MFHRRVKNKIVRNLSYDKMLPLLTLFVLSLLVASSAEKDVSDQLSWVDAKIFMRDMAHYLALKLDSTVAVHDVVDGAQNWLADYAKRGELTATLIKAHQAFLQIGRVENGQFCGLEGLDTVKLLIILKRASYDNHLYDSGDPSLSRMIASSLESHSKACMNHNLNQYEQAEERLDRQDLNRVYSLSDSCIRMHDVAGNPRFMKLERIFEQDLTTDLYDTVADQVDDNDVAQILPNSKGSMIPKDVLDGLYERHIYRPCLKYTEVLKEAHEPIVMDLLSLKSWDRNQKLQASHLRYSVCYFVVKHSPAIAYDNYVRTVIKKTGKRIKLSTFGSSAVSSKMPKFQKDLKV